MELSFVTSALRRYWWVIAGMAILGVLPGLLFGGSSGPPEFESRGVMLVSPPSDTFTGGDPDRYLSGQLSVLRSEALADEAAVVLADGSTGGDVGPNVRIEHEPQTDVITIVARSPSPERAQKMAQAYIDAYRLLVAERVAGSQEQRLAQLNEQIEAQEAEFEEVVAALERAMAPYANVTPPPLQEQVAPREVAIYEQISDELSDLRSARIEVETAQTRTGVETVQSPSLPVEPVPDPPNTLLVLGLVGGAMAGVVGAVVLARLSPNVLGDGQAEEVLRQPVVGAIPTVAGLDSHRSLLFDEVPHDANDIVEALCVRAETMGHGQGAVSIMVVGTERSAGATTVAILVARRFAEGGARTLLVDADRRDPALGRLASPHLDLLARDTDAVGTPTTIPGLSYLHIDDPRVSLGADGLRSTPAGELLLRTGKGSDIVVFDGGPVMESADTLRLARVADAVILVMPKRQRVQSLDTAGSVLRGRPLLPVWGTKGRTFLRLPSRRRHRRRPGRAAPPADPTTGGDGDGELVLARSRDQI